MSLSIGSKAYNIRTFQFLVDEAKSSYMKNNKIVSFVESFVLLPMMTITLPIGDIPKVSTSFDNALQTTLSQQENIEAEGLLAFNQALDQKAKVLRAKADAIDAYYKSKDMPLYGSGMTMVLEAEKNGLDWRLLPAISVIESTGGKFKCKKVTHSFMGWGSCKINFESDEEAIRIVAMNLGGNNPNTAKYYKDKTTEEILIKYNPPHIVPNYTEKVVNVMNSIGEKDFNLPLNS